MTLDEYLAELRKEAETFAEYWREEHKHNPEYYPLDMPGGANISPCNTYHENIAFLPYLDSLLGKWAGWRYEEENRLSISQISYAALISFYSLGW